MTSLNRVLRLSLLCLALQAAVAQAGRNRWTSNGPEGGHVSAFTVSPSNPDVVYVMTAGAGLFRSQNRGRNWTLASSGIQPYGRPAVDAGSPSKVYVVANASLFRTNDGGDHWTAVGGLPGGSLVFDVAADPKTPGIVYVAATVGVFKSVDGGGTWILKSSGLSGPQFETIAVAPSDPQVLYAASGPEGEGGIFVTTSGGDSWSRVTAPVTFAEEFIFDPRNPSTAFARSFGSGTFLTRNLGASWAPVDFGGGAGVTAVTFDPSNPSIVFAATDHPFESTDLYRSLDDGVSWTHIGSGPPGETIEALAAISTSTLLAGFSSSGIFRSDDGGGSWAASNAGLVAVGVSALSTTAVDRERLYAAAGGRILRSDDGGGHWKPTTPLPGAVSVLAMAADPQAAATVYVIALGPGQFSGPPEVLGSFRTMDAGDTWDGGFCNVCAPTFRTAIAVDPVDPGIVYETGEQWGLYKSTDHAQSFVEIDDGLGLRPDVLAIAIDPVVPTRLYVSVQGDGLYRSVDGGSTWRPTALRAAFVTQIVVARAATPTILAVTDLSGEVVRSVDLGSSWTATSGLPNDPYIVLSSDPTRQSVFYAGISDGRVFTSIDGGATWAPLVFAGLPDAAITGLSTTTDGRLLAATAGVYSIDFVHVQGVSAPAPAPIHAPPR